MAIMRMVTPEAGARVPCPIRVLIADDHPFEHQGLASIILKVNDRTQAVTIDGRWGLVRL